MIAEHTDVNGSCIPCYKGHLDPLFHRKEMTIHFLIQIKMKTLGHEKVDLEIWRVSLRGYVGWKCINTIEVDNINWIPPKLNQQKEKCIWKLEESHTLHKKK